MSNPLTEDARRRLLAAALQRLDVTEIRPEPTVPISAKQWQVSLGDARLLDHREGLAEATTRLFQAACEADARSLREAADHLADSALEFQEDLHCLGAFISERTAQIEELHDAVRSVALSALDAAVAATQEPSFQTQHRNIAELVDTLAHTDALPDVDAAEAAFGVPLSELVDARGVTMPTRLLAAYYGRYDDLDRTLRHLLSAITHEPPDLINALDPALALVTSDRPFLTLRTARRASRLFDSLLDGETIRLARTLRRMKLRVDRSAASHERIIRASQALDKSDSDTERAELTLDLYRRVSESQLRPWAWTLLQLRANIESGAMPELGRLRQQLLSHPDPLLIDAAEAMLPVARNAEAHEDFIWNEDTRQLIVGDDAVTIAELEDATERALAFMYGCESAWACARSLSTTLARLLDLEDPATGMRSINERSALTLFGTNGLHVKNWRHQHDTLEITLDDLPFRAITPCFQAVMWASRQLSRCQRFVVRLPERTQAVIDLPRPPLDATFLVWRKARATFTAMPTSTFLPAETWTRLAVEPPDAAARAAAWLALNDAINAYDEAHTAAGARELRLHTLALRLDIVATAAEATLPLLPADSSKALRDVAELVRPAATWAGVGAQGRSTGPSEELERSINELFDSWPVVSVLPTLDPRPLDVIENEVAP